MNALAVACSSARRMFVPLLRPLLLRPPLLLISAVSQAAAYTLNIKAGTHTINGAGKTTLKVWSFIDYVDTGLMVLGSLLESQEGKSVTVTVYSRHTLPRDFVVAAWPL